MAFPSTPTIGQQYTQDGRTWQWDGVAWEILALAGPAGPPGVISATAPLALSSGVLSIDLSAYLTTSTAASTYQPLSGMSSYLTTSAAASTYQTLSGMSSYLTTSSAASTYQTISGMSSYLTTSAAATTYYPLSGNPSGFLTSAPVTSVAGRTGAITLAVADVSGAAPLASPTFTGTPLSTTAAVDTNTTQIATTAYVVGQGYAKLASPTFTGTPTLPTGTIATTQSPGDNTTALATTAFVTAAVPSFAATADINSPSSTTKVMSPSNVVDMIISQNYQLLYLGAGSSGTSGTGSYFGNNGGRWHELQSANASTSGYGAWSFDTNTSSRGLVATNRGGGPFSRNWSKKIWLSGRCIIGHTSVTTIDGDANTFFRCGLGGKNSFSVGDISAAIKGITFKIPGGGAAMILQVSNGSAVTSVTSSFTPTVRVVFDWKIYSDGAGNVTLYVNDSQVATTTAGPTSSLDNGLYFESVESNGSNTVGFGASTFGAKIYYAV